MMQIRIAHLSEAPEELFDQLPIIGTMVRVVPGLARPDYWLVQLKRPLSWFDQGIERGISYLLVASRFAGVVLGPGTTGVTVGILLVTDASLLAELTVAFEHCVYVGIGDCDVIATEAEQD